MLKWKNDIGTMHSMVREAGGSMRPAAASDLVACLKANPDAAGQVLLALESQYIAGELAKAKVEQETLEAENAQLQSKIDTLEMMQAPVGSLTSPPGCKEYAEVYRLFVSPRDTTTIEWTEREQERMRLNAEILVLKARAEKAERERDEARAELDVCRVRCTTLNERLSEQTQRADALGTERDEARAEQERTAQECANIVDGYEETLRRQRSRIAKLEAVVDALPWCESTSECDRRATRSDGYTELCDKHGEGWVEHPWAGAIRALDEQDSPRAIVDSDTARVGAADSTPGLSRLASAEPGDEGPNPSRAGSSGTPEPTGGAIPPAGAVFDPGPCPKCGRARKFSWCKSGFGCSWRHSSYHPPHSDDDPAFHAWCPTCHFEEVVHDSSPKPAREAHDAPRGWDARYVTRAELVEALRHVADTVPPAHWAAGMVRLADALTGLGGRT